MRIIAASIALLMFSGCYDGDLAKKTLIQYGFTEIEITGHAFFTCSKDDFSCTGFRAVNPQGAKVSGAVGCGLLFKGCTLRF